MGTCGWSAEDAPWGRGRTAADKLAQYVRHFGCVELDTATYAIPAPHDVQRWAAAVPRGFLFHIKLFGLFCSMRAAANSLPRAVRDTFGLAGESKVCALAELPTAAVDAIWDRFHAAVLPLQEASKMGVVVAQFHLGFKPGEAARRHIEWVRSRLCASLHLALEFRDRSWLDEGSALDDTVAWIQTLPNTSLVAADDLKHETQHCDKAQRALKPGEPRVQLPIHVRPDAAPELVYCRIHRREGAHRVLTPEEVSAWADRLRPLGVPGRLRGPVFFMWGTDWADQPLVNARNLAGALGAQAADWPAWHTEQRRASKGSLQGFLAQPSSPAKKRPRLEGADADAVSSSTDQGFAHYPPNLRTEPTELTEQRSV
eukprot:EG_transcript_15320